MSNYMSRQAKPSEIRAEYRDNGYECRIHRDGAIRYRKDRDRYPGADTTWLFGGWINYYRFHKDTGVIRP